MRFYNKPKEFSLQKFFTYYIYTIIILFVPVLIYLYDVMLTNYVILAIALFVIADFALLINAYFLYKRKRYIDKFIKNNNINYIELYNDKFDVVYCDNSTKMIYENDISEVNLNISFSKTYHNVIARILGYESSDIKKTELSIVCGNDVYAVFDECFGTYTGKYRTIFKAIDLLKHFSKFQCDILGSYKASVAEKINTYLKYSYFKFISAEYTTRAILTSIIFILISIMFIMNMEKVQTNENAMIMLALGILSFIPALIIIVMFLIDFINKRTHR